MRVESRSRPLSGSPDRGGRALGRLHRIVDGALLLLILGTALAAVVTHLAPLGGVETFIIRGSSMEPAIPLGALVAVAPADDPQVGEVITYRAANGAAVTHRIAGFVTVDGTEHLLTKGDMNDHPDATPVHPDSIVGRVGFYLPAAGYMAWLLSSPAGLVGLVTAFLALLVCLWLIEEVQSQHRQPARPRMGEVL